MLYCDTDSMKFTYPRNLPLEKTKLEFDDDKLGAWGHDKKYVDSIFVYAPKCYSTRYRETLLGGLRQEFKCKGISPFSREFYVSHFKLTK